ncbi:MAG TPA: FAD-dependent oxidoreductase [Solirubrobacteraceae bacterium]
MADRQVDFLLVGGGAASAACAEALRAGGADGSILLVGREPDPPYERPPASKGYLRGESARADALLHPPEFWAEQGIELLTRTSAMKLDPAAREVRLSTKETVGYGAALVATGANVRRLRLDGGALEGIHHLRALGNADALRADVEGVDEVVLVGGSYIACEVAASLTAMGKRCTLVMEETLPLSRGFGETAGAWVAEMLRSRGVELVCGDPVERFAGEGRVSGVVTRSGREVPAGAVVMGTGAVPDVMLARAAGLELGETGGVACDACLRTSAPGVWAAGDVCEYDSVVHGRRVRIEHWEVARAQGRAAARGMLGSPAPYDEIPYFWADLADWATLEYVGPAERWDAEVVRGAPDEGAFSILYLHEGRVVAALAVGRPEDLDGARALIRARTGVGGREAELADPARPLAAA